MNLGVSLANIIDDIGDVIKSVTHTKIITEVTTMSKAVQILILLAPVIVPLLTDVEKEYDILTGSAQGTPSQKAVDALKTLTDIINLIEKVV